MEALFRKQYVILCAIVILVLSIMPADNAPQIGIPNIDKLVHLGMYAMLSALLYGFLVRNDRISTFWKMSTAFLMASIYGVFIEILQYQFFESRSFEFYDIISNIMGSILGVLFVNNFFNSKK